MGHQPRMSQSGKTGAMVYGVVVYDFKAERPDELDAKEGEAIIVIAQSNPEWFVAKPITRLGGPGLQTGHPAQRHLLDEQHHHEGDRDDRGAQQEACLVLIPGVRRQAASFGGIQVCGQLRPRIAEPRPPDLDGPRATRHAIA